MRHKLVRKTAVFEPNIDYFCVTPYEKFVSPIYGEPGKRRWVVSGPGVVMDLPDLTHIYEIKEVAD